MTDRTVALAVALVFAATACVALGSGFVNGDAAVYAHQASELDLGQRQTHLGFIAPAAALGVVVGRHLPLALDVVTLAACLAWIAGSGAAAKKFGGNPGIAAALVAAAALPLASWSEVDPLWLALLTWAATVAPVGSGFLVAAAVAVSPTALLGIPLVVAARQDRAPVIGAVLAVCALTAATWGAWWWGDRGVLVSGHLAPGRVVAAVLWTAPWLAVAAAWRQGWTSLAVLGLCTPILVSPPDVPAWGILATGLAVVVSRQRAAAWAIAPHAAIAVMSWWGTWERVAHERAVIAATARDLGAGDVVIAPWSWGVRVSLARSGHPYRWPWRTPDERSQWPDARRTIRLPPQLDSAGTEAP